MSTTHRLKESLLRALSSQESHDDEQELFDQLMVQKPHLLKLFDFGTRNPREQTELESGLQKGFMQPLHVHIFSQASLSSMAKQLQSTATLHDRQYSCLSTLTAQKSILLGFYTML